MKSGAGGIIPPILNRRLLKKLNNINESAAGTSFALVYSKKERNNMLNLKSQYQAIRIQANKAKRTASHDLLLVAVIEHNKSEIAKLAEKLTIRATIRQAFNQLSQKRS